MSEKRFSEQEIQLIRLCQEDIPLSEEPFAELAHRLGADEEWVYTTLSRWKEEGVLRGFRAILYHQRAGYRANGMSVWAVPEHRIDEVGKTMASLADVSHCYHRPILPNWHYNVYAMLHGHDKEEVKRIALKISKLIGIDDYKILFSVREFKKSSMKYFVPEKENQK